MSKLLRIEQVHSGIKRLDVQKRTLRALGLRGIRSVVLQPDNPQIRGMVFQVKHLVKVQEIEQ